VETARRHFDNINIDLMYALPRQEVSKVRSRTSPTAIALGPTHISAYHLTIEPNTLFHRFNARAARRRRERPMQEEIENRLAGAGFQNYETSAFACRATVASTT